MSAVRCTLCGPDTYLPAEGIVDHLETVHTAVLKQAARWPDGQLVVINEDEYGDE